MPHSQIDFVIITPLAEERDAVLAQLPGCRKLPPSEDDIRVYYAADIPVHFSDRTSSHYAVIVVPLAKMGHTEAASATGDAIRRWRPRYVLLVGIAGGLAQAEVQLGDILISEQVADYELQKVTDKQASIRWQVHRVDQRLLIAAQNFTDPVWEQTTVRRPSRSRPKTHFGPICTGNKVVADESLTDQFREVWEKLIGVEMEAGGVANAVSQAARMPGFFMIRAVSDLADGRKDSGYTKRWRPYACEIAAAYAIEFLKSGPVPVTGTVDKEAANEQETSLPLAMQDLKNIVCAADRPTDLNLLPDTLAEILRHAPRNPTEYRLNRIADWSQPRYELDKRFVQLTLLLDKGEDAQGPRWESSRQFQDLRDVLQETLDTPALVLLGPPGSGKSTLLRRLEWDLAVDALRDPTAEQTPLSFFVPLNQYQPARSGGPLPEPRQWLAERWAQRFPGLPSVDDWLRAGRGILLLDALNEMPSAGRDAIGQWKAFLWEMAQTCPGSRFIFSCRSLDYSSSLSSKDLTVPHVRIESLSDVQVEHFLQVYSPHGDTLWRHLKGTPQLDLYRTPIYLKMLVNQADAEGHIPEGRAALFTGFVRQALQRERHAENPRFQPDELLTQRDCERLTQHRWKHAYDLPGRGVLIPKLASLAHRMQQQRIATEASQVRIDYDQALAILDHAKAEMILKAGVDLGVLDLDVDDVLYIHQLMQEYFAARCLAAAPDAERVRTEWRADCIDPSLLQVLARLADADPLPPAPQTGWEETTVLAVAMNTNPEAFVTALMATNLPLAGRCAAQPDVRISEDLKTRIRWALVERTQDSNADLRARIAAGLSLGPLGDPRFERRKGPYGDYLLPLLVTIPGGTYTLGSEEGESSYIVGGEDRERPIHQVQLAPFQIGKFPVTNAEWKLFMDAGGYEDERWWDTEVAKAWRQGEGTAEGAKQPYRDQRKWFQDHLDTLHEYKQLTAVEIEEWTKYAQMSDGEFEALLSQEIPSGRQTQPSEWNNDAFNNPAQPVVGVCWYEARAYCAWLSAQTGQAFRLPTEAEWEAAARGGTGRRYAYGNDFDATRCNTFKTHIRRTTPVGVFPGGETLEGLVDMTGNTWDWTSSLYRPYPYVATDGREEPMAEDRRVVRGGAWYVTTVSARAASRHRFHPANRYVLGLRVVVGSSPISEH